MVNYLTKRAIEIFREQGAKELFWKLNDFRRQKTKEKLRGKLFHAYTYKNNIKNNLLYDAPPKPYATLRIPANSVKYLVCDGSDTSISKPHFDGFAQTKGGVWPDKNNMVCLDNYYIKSSFEQRFLEKYNWEDTEYYAYLRQKKEYSKKRSLYLLNNLDNLYQSILQDGYQSGHSKKNHKNNHGYREGLEPFVIIDDKGELYLWDGRHRLCIAQILDIEIPVHVLCRHEKWQEIRDRIYNKRYSEDYNELRNHPDLRDVHN